jgi:ketosteroid isomerase-like protein
MRHRFAPAALGLALAVLGSGCAAVGSEPPERRPLAKAGYAAGPAPAELRRFFDAYFRAVEDGEPDKILAHIDANFVIRWGGPPIQDSTRLRALLERLQATVRQTVEWELLEGGVAGDWAWARIRERAAHHPVAGGEPRVFEGTQLMILRRSDGRWRMHRNHGLLDQPAVAEPAG